MLYIFFPNCSTSVVCNFLYKPPRKYLIQPLLEKTSAHSVSQKQDYLVKN